MTDTPSWMLYGATGYTGALIATHALDRGLRPVVAGRSAPAVAALAERLGLPHRTVTLDDPAALRAGLAEVDLVLNAAGPFLHTATPLAEACVDVGVHYLDISNELQVFRSLYDLHRRAERAGVAIIPGVGFGVVATNCLARYVSDAVGGAERLEVATRAVSAQPGPGVAATVQENLPFGGWIRAEGHLEPKPLGEGITTLTFPDGLGPFMPVPTGDLEAAFLATGATDVVAYTSVAEPLAADPAPANDEEAGADVRRSFGWARATGADGAATQAWLETGDSYNFTVAASIRAVQEALRGAPAGALSPAAAFGADFALTVPDTTRIDAIPGAAAALPAEER